MIKNKRLKEAIDGVGMVNNLDSQDFDKKSVGTAPISYADAVIRARKRKEACKKAYEDQVKAARGALKKEVSNEEHPEPVGKIRGRKEGKMTLDEGLFESFDDEHLGHGDDVCPKCGKNPCECKVEESLFEDTEDITELVRKDMEAYKELKKYRKGSKAYKDAYAVWLDLHAQVTKKMFGGNVSYTVNEGLEGAEEKKVYRVTYKHSPQVFSSVMLKAASEDEAKQKLAVEEPGKDIVGVSVMSDDEVKDMKNRGMSLMEARIIDDFSSYEPWGAAVSTFDSIQNADKMDALEQLIDEMYPDGIDKTELNDLLAFESDWIYSMLDMPHDEDVVYDDVAVEVEDDEEEE